MKLLCRGLRFSHLRHRLQFVLMGQTIEELLGVGTRNLPLIKELIKFGLNELHSIEIIVDRSWNLLRANEEFALSTFALKKLDCTCLIGLQGSALY